MKPTLLIGDYFVAAKYSYGYSRYSFPGSPAPFVGRIFAAQPRYGDVVVFRLPREPLTDYVKRVVGLPGDRIQVTHGLLHINGTPVKPRADRGRRRDRRERTHHARETMA